MTIAMLLQNTLPAARRPGFAHIAYCLLLITAR